MSVITDEEWAAIEGALVRGGLRETIDRIVLLHEAEVRGGPEPVQISDKNRAILYRAYDDGDGNNITLEHTDDSPWFSGTYEGFEVMLGLEHNGVLYSLVHLSGGGLVSVIVGEGIVNNEVGVTFPSITTAKAYVKGLTSR